MFSCRYTVLVLTLSIIFFVTESISAQWSIIATGTNQANIFFLDANDGFGVGSAGFSGQRSVDGGVTWQSIFVTGRDIFFADSDKGHIVVNTNTGPPTYIRSVNGGNSWQDLSSVFPNSLGAIVVEFPDTSNC